MECRERKASERFLTMIAYFRQYHNVKVEKAGPLFKVDKLYVCSKKQPSFLTPN